MYIVIILRFIAIMTVLNAIHIGIIQPTKSESSNEYIVFIHSLGKHQLCIYPVKPPKNFVCFNKINFHSPTVNSREYKANLLNLSSHDKSLPAKTHDIENL